MTMRPIGVGAAALAAVAASAPVHARPVSYEGGWTVMQMNSDALSSLHVHYSPSARWSVGWLEAWDREEDWVFTGAQLNRLVWRRNTRQSQANLYLKGALGGAGAASAPLDVESWGGMAEIAADWETRRLFASYAATLWEAGGLGGGASQAARLGLAPYLGDYGDLHTWLMVELRHRPEAEDAVTVTPMLRFFKGVQLVELGATDRGDAVFNWVIRF